MKKRIVLLALITLIMTSVGFAQYPNPGDNILNPNLDKFVGSWKYTSDSIEIIIELKKVNYFSKMNYHYDILMGVHSYKINGIVIEDYLSNFNAIGQNLKGTIFIGNLPDDDPNKVTGTINDSLKHKQNYISLLYMAKTTVEIELTLNNMPGPHVEKNGEPFDNGFTLPRTFVLVKK